ncbi:MAG: hypothetical protein ABIE23_03940 [archaeon]|nr:hypothetical protein [Candidatus Micrarchaeota archaeon]
MNYTLLLVLFSITDEIMKWEFFSDMNFVLKIFVLLTIISFIKMNIGTGALGIILMAGISYFVLFDLWKLFGGIYLMYMLLFLGLSHILVDFFFVSGGHEPTPEEAMRGKGGMHGQGMAHTALRGMRRR